MALRKECEEAPLPLALEGHLHAERAADPGAVANAASGASEYSERIAAKISIAAGAAGGAGAGGAGGAATSVGAKGAFGAAFAKGGVGLKLASAIVVASAVSGGVLVASRDRARGDSDLVTSASASASSPATTVSARPAGAEPAGPALDAPRSVVPQEDATEEASEPSAAPAGRATEGHATTSASARPAVPSVAASSSDSGAPEGFDVEVKLIQRAQAALRATPADALVLADEHGRRFPRGVLAQEREVVAIEALVRTGRIAEARTRAAAFKASYPGSSHGRRVDTLLDP